MKKLLILFTLLSLPLVSNAQYQHASKVSAPECVSGVIQSYKHNSDETVSVTVQNKELYTQSWNLEHMLFTAYIDSIPVTIRSDNCYEGGEFTEVRFNKP